jgi:hypothetical protein
MTTKHIHAEVMTQWVNDQSLIVECYRESTNTWIVAEEPMWYRTTKYRIQPKTDVVYAQVYYDEARSSIDMTMTTKTKYPDDNLKITFEGTNVTNMEFLK